MRRWLYCNWTWPLPDRGLFLLKAFHPLVLHWIFLGHLDGLLQEGALELRPPKAILLQCLSMEELRTTCSHSTVSGLCIGLRCFICKAPIRTSLLWLTGEMPGKCLKDSWTHRTKSPFILEQ